MRTMLKSKIHRATVTHVDRDYEGSLGIDGELMRQVDIIPFEQVHVLNISNGNRFETYVIEEPAGNGRIGVYGAAAHLATPGDMVIILAYRQVSEDDAINVHPLVLHVDSDNAPRALERALAEAPPPSLT